MNILFFHSNEILPEKGGISRTTYNLTKSLRECGHNVFLLGYRNIYPECTHDINQAFIPSAIGDSFEDMVCFLNLYLRNKSIDIIINQNPFVKLYVDLIYSAKRGLECKVISCYHNTILTPIYNYAYQREYVLKSKKLGLLFYVLKNKFINKLLVEYYICRNRSIYENTIHKSDKVVLLCEGLRDELAKISGLSDSDKYVIIPNMIPENEDINNVVKKNKVLWVGTFDNNVKRPDLALKIWERLGNNTNGWELHLLGDGPALDEMKSLSKKMKLNNVIFEGRRNPYRFYRESKIIMVTSTHESFSLVTVEAMSNKCVPILFNSFPAAKKIIKGNKTGFLIPAFSIDSFSEKMISLMKNPKILETIGEEAQIESKKYCPINIVELWNRLFNHL